VVQIGFVTFSDADRHKSLTGTIHAWRWLKVTVAHVCCPVLLPVKDEAVAPGSCFWVRWNGSRFRQRNPLCPLITQHSTGPVLYERVPRASRRHVFSGHVYGVHREVCVDVAHVRSGLVFLRMT
jgi:hypothetical protein